MWALRSLKSTSMILFLVYAYTASITFFVGLYQVFTLIRYIGQGNAFTAPAVKTLWMIKCCAIALIGFVLLPELYLMIVRPGDDIAGGVAMGLFIMCMSAVIAAAASVGEKLLQSAVDVFIEGSHQ